MELVDEFEIVTKPSSTVDPVKNDLVLAPGALDSVEIRFTPSHQGSRRAGLRLVTSDSAHAPDLVVCDIARVDAEEVAEAWPDIPILGFTNHTDTAGLRAANAAGFDRVIVKSALVERAAEIVAELV